MSRAAEDAVTLLDWDRVASERETTAAALSVALQRLASAEREVEELDGERRAKEGTRQGELNPLRAALRRPERKASRRAERY